MNFQEAGGDHIEKIARQENLDKSAESKQKESREKLHQAAREKFEKTGARETIIYKDENFDVYDRLSEVKGPLIEVGGPTDNGYDLVDTSKLDKKIYVSNLFPGAPYFEKGKFIGYEGPVDFQADARDLPLKPESVGAIFLKALGEVETTKDETPAVEKLAQQKKLREETLAEAAKMLEPGGVLLMETVDELELIEKGEQNGLRLVEQRMSYSEGNDVIGFDFMFIKE